MRNSDQWPEQISPLDADKSASPSFEELVEQRAALQGFCSLHVPSVEFFSAKSFPVFRLSDREPQKFQHITSTATCYESLDACPTRLRPKGANFEIRAREFSSVAADLDQDAWKSDESAYIYCRCRGLPYVLSRLTTDALGRSRANFVLHLDRILAQLQQDPTRAAIGEADSQTQALEDWYPPNAYHTYWTFEIFDSCQRFPEATKKFLERRFKLSQTAQRMREWARQALGYQVSLHSAGSSVLDSDQLAWALASVIRDPSVYQSKLSEQDFIREAFRCLFSTQTEVGTWRRYAPLFHYKKSGNAHCYVFETFSAILKQALRPEAKFAREVLKTYFRNLIRLWEYAKTTQTTSDGTAKKLAWSSGHRVTQPIESWATASVFAYAQSLRRLVGIWTREESIRSLNRPRPFASRRQSIKKLDERSNIWKSVGPPLGDALWSMFINQTRMAGSDDRMEPDLQPIGEDRLRSAILFGPPGTSKTTIVKALAGSIQWDYIEVHASHFVSDGLPNVQKTADQLFKRLFELDHAVVLFDEIDELVRAREIEKDAFGRFLTTSMLPKLAELWDARKIMYFVATNHIEFFDPAITRSQRFDAVLFVSPPSFEMKRKELKRLIQERYGLTANLVFEQRDIESALDSFNRVRTSPPVESVLAKFALLRFDELGELALNLRPVAARKDPITSAVLANALTRIQDARWRPPQDYSSYLDGPSFERFDLTKVRVWRVIKPPQSLKSPYSLTESGRSYVVAAVKSLGELEIAGHQVLSETHGRVRIRAEKKVNRARKVSKRNSRKKRKG